MATRSISCYGLIINQLIPKTQSSRDIFTYFDTLNSLPFYFPFCAHQIPPYIQPPTFNEIEAILPIWAQFLVGRELFHGLITRINANVGVEVCTPQFFARQFGFGQTWLILPCYSKNFKQHFHTITRDDAKAIESPSAPSAQTDPRRTSSKKRPSSHQADDSDEEDTPTLVRKKIINF
ncbi:Uncharacterized protein Adt_14346 [Abeliophyllum distichum]|uniref:Uncharacterized protein n=1 Tax=Abeliophyllum distichum TaxID=126358 RepID=A0ABD1TZD7_9LAMI